MTTAELVSHTTIQNPLDDPRQLERINQIIAENRSRPGGTMVILNELQTEIGFISGSMQRYIADQLAVPVSTVHGVVTFYSFFSTKPRGRHAIKFCTGTACYVGGIDQLIDKGKQLLGVDLGETTSDGEITIETCRCVGACSQAPVVVVDEEAHGYVRPNKLPQLIRRVQDGKNR